MKRIFQLAVHIILFIGISAPAFAQDIYEQYYGSGVHAYFAGNYERASELFNELIDAGSQDPRVHYFRGLTQMQTQGSMIEIGLADFEQAAQLEVSGKRSVDVSKALSRIQGPTRIAIERMRAKARFAAKSLQADAILRSGASGMMNPVDPTAPRAADPFSGGAGLTGGEPRPMPTPTEPPANSSSPFDNPPAPGATSPAGEPTMPTPDSTNPFGDDTPTPPAPAPAASDNPFGT
jgi:hypothetical protein